jgi:hypothetical protein
VISSLAAPGTPFGRIVAAFDDAMTPVEWKVFTDAAADARLREGCLEIWRVHAIPRFEARYAVVVSPSLSFGPTTLNEIIGLPDVRSSRSCAYSPAAARPVPASRLGQATAAFGPFFQLYLKNWF